jgi:hypothetical protein
VTFPHQPSDWFELQVCATTPGFAMLIFINSINSTDTYHYIGTENTSVPKTLWNASWKKQL